MTRTKKSQFLLGSIAFVASVLPQAASAQQRGFDPQPPAAVGTPAVDDISTGDIIVTASKRSEKLRDVPATISALTSQVLEAQGVRSFRDYATLVPGVSHRDTGAPGLGTIIIRGLNSGPVQSTNTAAFYVDDITYTAASFGSSTSQATPSPDLTDVERLEVLKGPQGTLYGASSLGGLIRVVTRKPEATSFSGMAQIEGVSLSHGGSGWAARGAINLPLIQDKLAIRASGFYRDEPGWVDNVVDGRDNVNSSTIKGARLALRATPSDTLTIDISGFIQNIDNNGMAQQDNVQGTTTPLYGKYRYAAVSGTGTSTVRYRSVAGTVNYDTGAGSIVASASYLESRLSLFVDYSRNYGAFLAQLGVIPAGSQIVTTVGPNTDKTSVEARFVSNRLGPIEFVGGGYYTYEVNTYPGLLVVRDAAGVPLPPPLDIFASNDARRTYDEYAGFGNLTVYLSDQLDVTGGLRYAKNRQTYANPASIINFQPSLAVYNEFGDASTTYLATMRYRPTSSLSLYARVASGYRPGGPQINVGAALPPGAQSFIRPDTVWNYEAGLKGSFFDDMLNVNAAVYQIDWKEIQLNSFFGGFAFYSNGGDARVKGFELELLARPVRGLVVGANAGHTDARITRIDPQAQISIGAASGDKLPLTPPWTAAVFVDHTVPLSGGLEASWGGTLRFQSDMPSGFPGALINRDIKVPSITTVDLRAGLRLDRLMLQFRVENLFNQLGYSTLTTSALFAGQAVPTTATVIRPRAFALAATVAF